MLLALEWVFPALLLCFAYLRNRLSLGVLSSKHVSILVYCVQAIGLFFTLQLEHDLANVAKQNNFSFFYSHVTTILVCFFHVFYSLDFIKKVISVNTLYAFLAIFPFAATSDMWILFWVFFLIMFFILMNSEWLLSRRQVSVLLALFVCLLLRAQLKHAIYSIVIGIEAFIAILVLLYLVYCGRERNHIFLLALFFTIISKFGTPLNSFFAMIICYTLVIYYLVKIAANGPMDKKWSLADLFFIIAPFDLLLWNTFYFVQTLFILVIYKSFNLFKRDTRFNLIQSVLFCLLTCTVLSIGDLFSEIKFLSGVVLVAKLSIIIFFLFSERRYAEIGNTNSDRPEVSILVFPVLFLLYKYEYISLNPILGVIFIMAFIIKIVSLYHPSLVRNFNLSALRRLKLFMKIKLEANER